MTCMSGVQSLNKNIFIAIILFCVLICTGYVKFTWKHDVILKTSASPDVTETYKQNEEKIPDPRNLKHLYDHYNYSCPDQNTFDNVSDILICGDIKNVRYNLVLFTTMYYDVDHMPFFLNTVRVTASLQSDFSFQGVVYIDNPRSFIDKNATYLIRIACNLGLVVLLAPHCNEDNFPVFKSMFNVSMQLLDADWYGYSNGDILFDDSLLTTLDFIQYHITAFKVPIFAGRRYNIAVGD